jgi:hypothetical protein
MFACDQPVILPHASRQKCTCMDCNAMCPKMINNTKIKSVIRENSTLIEKIQLKITNLYKIINPHKITIITIGIYILFVIAFISSNILLSVWKWTSNKKKFLVKSKKIFFSIKKFWIFI